uniref:Uncharacterized protein n=1 Tax=Zea mays TaxID=4577 RepID=A0A804MJB0_MAIZE
MRAVLAARKQDRHRVCSRRAAVLWGEKRRSREGRWLLVAVCALELGGGRRCAGCREKQATTMGRAEVRGGGAVAGRRPWRDASHGCFYIWPPLRYTPRDRAYGRHRYAPGDLPRFHLSLPSSSHRIPSLSILSAHLYRSSAPPPPRTMSGSLSPPPSRSAAVSCSNGFTYPSPSPTHSSPLPPAPATFNAAAIIAPDSINPWWSLLEEAVKSAGNKLGKLEIFPASTNSCYFRQIRLPAFGFSSMTNTPILLHETMTIMWFVSLVLVWPSDAIKDIFRTAVTLQIPTDSDKTWHM